MAVLTSTGWVDARAAEAAARRLQPLVIGPRPSRTNPTGGRTAVLDPRSALAAALPRVATFCIERIREYTPKRTGKVRESYNVRRAFGSGASKGSLDFVRFEVGSDLPRSEQVVVSTLEYGSVPHVIRARNAKFMRIPLDPEDVGERSGGDGGGGGGRGWAFIVEEAGRPVLYAKSVQHPGTQPHGMFRRTLQDVIPVAERTARDVVSAVSATWSDETVNAYARSALSAAGR